MTPAQGLRRCMRCGEIIYEDDSDYRENIDLPEFCDLCNDELLRDEEWPGDD